MALGTPGIIRTVRSLFLNLSEQTTDGYDLEVRYLKDTSRWGSFRLSTYVTYMDSFESALLSADPLEQIAGQYLRPRLRATTDFSWNYDDF